MQRRLKLQAKLVKLAGLYGRTFAPKPVGLFLTLLAVNLSVCPGRGDIIPPDRLYPWQGNVGVSGGIPSRPIGKNAVIDYGADPTGVNDSRSAIQNAINNSRVGTAAFLPAGTYKIVGSLTPKTNRSLRGAGMGQTAIKQEGPGSNGIVNNSGDYPDHTPSIAILSGATKGSTSVTVDTTSGAAIHKLITISALNPAYVFYDPSRYGLGPGDDGHDKTRLLNSTHYITSIRGHTICFKPPLPFEMANEPKITPWTAILSGSGIEDLTFDMTNSVALSAVYLSQAYGCWVRGVEVFNPKGRQVWFKKMVNSEIRGCYFHDSAGTGSNHEGLDLVQNDCFNLVEDNICIDAGKPAIVIGDWGGGCAGNVIAYNYVHNANTSQNAEEDSISVNHGPHNVMNLVEGNVCQSVKSDGYFGSSSHNTFLRNYVSGDRPFNVDWPLAVNYARWSYYSNFVANVLGKSRLDQVYQPSEVDYSNKIKAIWKLGYPNTGNSSYAGTYTGSPTTPGNTAPTQMLDEAVESSMIRHGNFDYVKNEVTWDNSISDRTLPSSYYLETQPNWWPTTLSWPPIGPDRQPMISAIPAEIRYLAKPHLAGNPAANGR